MSRSASKLGELTAALQELRPELDELTRARVQARLLDAIDDAAAPAPVRSLSRRGAWSLAAVAVLAAAAVLLIHMRAPAPHTASVPLARRTMEAVAPPAVAAPLPSPAGPLALVPHALAGSAAAGLLSRLGLPTDRLELNGQAVVRAAIGPRARLSLHGPGRLNVVSLTPARIELALDRGDLELEYDGEHGGELIVSTRHALVRVVGTLFGVRVDERQTTVGVSHGTVEVEDGSERHVLRANQAWRSRAKSVVPLAAEMKRSLDAHAASVRPPDAKHGLLSVEGSQRDVTAHLGAQLLGEPPAWALVPLGAVEVSLIDAAGAVSTVKTRVAERDIAAEGPAPFEPERRAASRASLRAPAVPAVVEPSALPPETSGQLYARAEQCLKVDDRECARRELERLIARFPNSAEAEPALYELGQATSCATAVPWLRRYVLLHPDGRFAAGAQRRLELCSAARP